jgi:hypothetical protein
MDGIVIAPRARAAAARYARYVPPVRPGHDRGRGDGPLRVLLHMGLRGVRRCLGPRGEEAARMSARDWRQLLPPITPKLVLRVLLGVLLFFVGMGLGFWVILFAKRYEKKFARQLAA